MSAPTYADVLRAKAAYFRTMSAYWAGQLQGFDADYYAKAASEYETLAAQDEQSEKEAANGHA